MIQLTDIYFAVEVPDDLLSPSYHIEQSISSLMNDEGEDDEFVIRHTQRKCGSPLGKVTIEIPPGNYRFLFTTKAATEEDARRVVPVIYNYHPETLLDEIFAEVSVETHLDSLSSLLRSKGLDENKNYAIIEKLSSDE